MQARAPGEDQSILPERVAAPEERIKTWAAGTSFGTIVFAVDPVDTMTTRRHRVAVRGTRGIGPANLVHNARLGTVDVDAATGMVSFDGERVYVDPVDRVPLSRLYFL